MGTRRTFAIVCVAAFILVSSLPAAASFQAPAVDEAEWDYVGMARFEEELRATARTPEELADITAAFKYIEENPEEVAAWLAGTEEVQTRESEESEGKFADFTVLRSDNKNKPVLIIHGRDSYNMAGYATLRNYYLAQGFTAVHRVGYYGGECNVEYNAEHHGSHNSWYGGSGEHSSKTGCNGVAGAQVHDLNTDIMHMAYHFAWMVHDHFGASSVTVDMLGHSMGGLIMRYAVAKSGSGGVWPPALRVEDAVTIGSPHGGLGTSWCKWSPWADVRQMCSDNYFITWMRSSASNPQGNGGTDWTVIGSDCDGWVAWNLAVDMAAAHKVVYMNPCYGHSDYYTDVSTASDATVDYMDSPSTSWSRWTTAPHSGRWTNNAAVYGTW